MPHVVIVGGGLAGLSLATKLVGRGEDWTVTVIEAQEKVGGRMTKEDISWEGGSASIDLGGQWVGPTHRLLLSLLKDLGLSVFPSPSEGNSILCFSRRTYFFEGTIDFAWMDGYEGKRPDFSPEVAEDFRQGWEKFCQLRDVLPRGKRPTEREWRSLDDETMGAWIERTFTTEEAKEYFRAETRFIGPLGPADPSQTSLLNCAFAQVIAPQGEEPEEFLVDGGMGQIPLMLRESLEKSGRATVRSGCVVTEVEVVEGGGKGGVRVWISRESESIKADVVALCIPPSRLSRLVFHPALPARHTTLFQRFPQGTCCKFLAVYDRPFWREKRLSGNSFFCSPDVLFEATADASKPGKPSGVLAVFIVGDLYFRWKKQFEGVETEKDPERRKSLETARNRVVLEELSRFYGEEALSPKAVVLGDWPANQFVGGAYSGHATPGTLTTVGEALGEAVGGRLFFGGTETALRWAGYLEGALESAERRALFRLWKSLSTTMMTNFLTSRYRWTWVDVLSEVNEAPGAGAQDPPAVVEENT
uniref:Amine oxidase n=1 Tax=Chromera velia CCMP2878 TaxID=1169474 RepID=A0A0G4I898_9ALVE|eukprot:Cvel_1985.t1-p1 / transcript=Cvel_1985.t1 / gene=Cvel_1985 / organism=Chromera_velia_CCMP2878 / gene_product=Uncharacterized protein slr0782, putative / transcript_product=Uncharacterized protein slr0782, putative / location=Cvel_scaffold75:104188-110556(-) / protein_length=531 / sequence_SO=supercontig / SO=protein_coding / is_pseudo=false